MTDEKLRYEVGQWVWYAKPKEIYCGANCGKCRSFEPAVEKMVVKAISKPIDDYGRVVELGFASGCGGWCGVRYEDVFRRRSAAWKRSMRKAKEMSAKAVMDCKDSRDFWHSERCSEGQSRLCVTGQSMK